MNHKMLASIGILLILFLVTSCGDGADNPFLEGGNSLIGTWRVVSIDGESVQQLIAEDQVTVTNEWTFHNNGKWRWIIRSEDVISIDMSGTYTTDGSNYTLIIDKGDARVFGERERLDESLKDTGTFVTEGSTLTLNSSDGSVIVLWKK